MNCILRMLVISNEVSKQELSHVGQVVFSERFGSGGESRDSWLRALSDSVAYMLAVPNLHDITLFTS